MTENLEQQKVWKEENLGRVKHRIVADHDVIPDKATGINRHVLADKRITTDGHTLANAS